MNVLTINGIDQITAELWNGLIDDGYPFLRHEFLFALENSGCVSAETGWIPNHLVIMDQDELIAALPMYLKMHSQGEYVFDNQWAYAAGHYRQQYYPKCLTAIPFTPCQGRRMLVKKGLNELEISALMFDFIKNFSTENGYSSWHCLFPDAKQLSHLVDLGLLVRYGIQFHWFNKGYGSFDDFLAGLNSRKRKMIRRERQLMQEQDIRVIQLPGNAVSNEQWGVFYDFYRSTYYKNGMPPYLNLEFFQRCAAAMGEVMLLVFALRSDKYVGAALSFIGTDTLFGRYWGCLEDYNALHFETCFYQGLDYCIANGLQRFDSGAQGEHKIARGFEPVTTHSAHWLKDKQFRDAVAHFLIREKNLIHTYKEDAKTFLPFKNSSTFEC